MPGDVIHLNVGGKRWISRLFFFNRPKIFLLCSARPFISLISAKSLISDHGNFHHFILYTCIIIQYRFSTSRHTLIWIPDSFFTRWELLMRIFITPSATCGIWPKISPDFYLFPVVTSNMITLVTYVTVFDCGRFTNLFYLWQITVVTK